MVLAGAAASAAGAASAGFSALGFRLCLRGRLVFGFASATGAAASAGAPAGAASAGAPAGAVSAAGFSALGFRTDLLLGLKVLGATSLVGAASAGVASTVGVASVAGAAALRDLRKNRRLYTITHGTKEDPNNDKTHLDPTME